MTHCKCLLKTTVVNWKSASIYGKHVISIIIGITYLEPPSGYAVPVSQVMYNVSLDIIIIIIIIIYRRFLTRRNTTKSLQWTFLETLRPRGVSRCSSLGWPAPRGGHICIERGGKHSGWHSVWLRLSEWCNLTPDMRFNAVNTAIT